VIPVSGDFSDIHVTGPYSYIL